MKSGFGILLALAVLAVLSLSGVYWVGVQAEGRARDYAAAHAEIGGWRYTLVSYERHWFYADAVSEVSVVPLSNPAAPLQMPQVTLRLAHHIVHGPRLGHLGLAWIQTTPVLGDAVSAALRPIFGDQAPLTWDTDVTFAGAQVGRISSPAARGPLTLSLLPQPVDVDWGGIDGHYSVTADRAAGDFTLQQPKLRIAGPQGNLEFDNFGVSGKGVLLAELPEIALGDVRVSLDHLHAEAAGQPLADLASLVLTGVTTSEPEGLKLVEDISADHFSGAGTELKALDLHYTLSNLDGPALSELIKRIQGLQSGAPDPAQQWEKAKAVFVELAPRILAKMPVFALDNIAVQIDGQPLHGSGRVQYVGSGVLAGFSPMADLEASVSATAPAALVESLAAGATARSLAMSDAASGAPMDAAQMQRQAQQQSQQTLQQLIGRKLLVQQGDMLRAEASLQKGVVLVNGAPFAGIGAQPSP